MIRVNYNGRFGNNLCQYILGRIISEELGYKLSVPKSQYDFLKGVNYGMEYHNPIEQYDGHILDLKQIINNYTPRQIVINGYFQRYEYYKSYRNRIKTWFNYFKEYYFSSLRPGENDLVLHIRGGDLWNNKLPNCQHAPIPLRFYQKVIQSTEYKDIYIVTENKEDPVVKKLIQIYPEIKIMSQMILEDFLFIYFAKNTVAISMSTLAWWAAWLSEVKTVHFPLYGFWHPDSPRQDIDMRVTDDERYVYHNFGMFNSWTASSDQVENILREL